LTGAVTAFPVPTGGSLPVGVAVGSDGNIWFTEQFGNNIGRITLSRSITEFPVPTPGGDPVGIVAGRDGNLWFTEWGQSNGSKIGRITTSGAITEYGLPTAGAAPFLIAAGSGSTLWFTESIGNNIGKIALGPPYGTCLLYDPTKAVHSGSTIPIKLELCDASGNDKSSSSITLHAVSITQVSTATSGTVEDAGNANPDSNFRFDATLGSAGAYVFNLKTRGLTTGTYQISFTVTGDSSMYTALFQVR
jgi:hypothetical protein